MENQAKKQISSHAAVAKLCRQYLKARGIQCRVSSKSYTGGNSVHVTVYDQMPGTMRDLEAEFSKYEYGHFDGMTDCYEYSNRRGDVPQVKYLFVNNDASEELRQEAWSFIRANCAGADQYPENLVDVPSHARVFNEYASTMIHRVIGGGCGDLAEKFWQQRLPNITLSPVSRPEQPAAEPLNTVGYVADENGNYTMQKASPAQILELAAAIIEQKITKGQQLLNPADTRNFLSLKLAGRESEVFAALYLDTRHRVIAFEELFHGTIDGCAVYPREVVKAALKHNASAVIFSHNHPSGNTEPSRADETITSRLKSALALIDVRVIDHIIVGGDNCTSFSEIGLL